MLNRSNFVLMFLLSVFALSVFVHADSSYAFVNVNLLSQNPDPATAGDVLDLRFSVENQGDITVPNTIVEIIPSYPFYAVDGESLVQSAGTLTGSMVASDAKVVKFKLRVDKDASAGSYTLKVKFSRDGANFSVINPISIQIRGKESAEIIHIDKTVILPGKLSNLTFVINNVGNAPLRNLVFKWENAEGVILPVGSDNSRFVKYLDVGSSVDLSYEVMADTNVDPALYSLVLNLTYEDALNGSQKNVVTKAGVYIGGETDFDAAFSDSTDGKLSFSVANIGRNPAYSVTVSVPAQRGWTVRGSNSAIIGNLNKGDYTLTSFAITQSTSRNFTANSNVPQDANRTRGDFNQSALATALVLQISYTDTIGDRHVISKELQLSASDLNANATALGAGGNFARGTTRSGLLESYGIYALGLVVLVAAFFVYKKQKTGKWPYIVKNWKIVKG